ncbi:MULTISPECIES: hypothetical protein [Bradyrhizobium]|uniref:Uncharacterized protein n=1 Tax=Bradyrhizobium vignae TaxID=1549949 RepID=A0ABS4A9V5_9BRAD|nr:hypothetical protein [Bradyrhizobium vignae]MBP0116489.1 hypothetical protein [Bradyrhizobium vignae]
MANRLRFAAALIGSITIGVSDASSHHPGIGGIGGAGGIFTIGAGTLDEGQFASSTYVDYLRLKQLSEPTLLANVGNDVHGLQTVESYAVALACGITNDLTVSVRLPWVRRTASSKPCRKTRRIRLRCVTVAIHRDLAMPHYLDSTAS